MSRVRTMAALFTALFLPLIFPVAAFACPFCETGGKETAWFILAFLGTFILGMVFFLVAYLRSGGFRNSNQLANKIFEAEGASHDK